MAIMLAVTSSMFGFVNSARTVFEIDLERADMQQRARVSMAALFRDLVMAGAGLQMPAIAPFRRGDENPDLPGSAFSDRISVRYVPPDAATGGAVTITYALRDDAAGVPQLTRYDGRSTDLPVVDQLAGLRFEYFDASGQQIATGRALPTARGFPMRWRRIASTPISRRYAGCARWCECVRHARSWGFRSPISTSASMCRRGT